MAAMSHVCNGVNRTGLCMHMLQCHTVRMSTQGWDKLLAMDTHLDNGCTDQVPIQTWVPGNLTNLGHMYMSVYEHAHIKF